MTVLIAKSILASKSASTVQTCFMTVVGAGRFVWFARVEPE